jgi:hypothetical protein
MKDFKTSLSRIEHILDNPIFKWMKNLQKAKIAKTILENKLEGSYYYASRDINLQ